MSPKASLIAVFALFAVAGCARTAGTLPAFIAPGSSLTTPDSKARLDLRVRIDVPRSSNAARQRYVSVATKSMAVKVRHVTSERAVARLTLNLTAKAKECAKRPGELVCTASVSLLPGRYIVQIATFDRYNDLGNVLSEGQTVPVSVAPSRNTLVRLTLDGVPYSLAVTGINPAVHGSQNGPFEIYGTAAQPMRVMAFDADGNAIVGAGAPSYQIKLLNGTGWSVQATPPSATPNTFTISPPGAQGSTAMLSVTAAGSADCKEPKAQCTIGFSVANHLQTLFAGGTCRSGCTGEVLAYAPPYTGAPVTVDNSLGSITAMTTDSSGNLFVASCNVSCGDGTAADSVTEYAPPYTGGASVTITNGITTRFLSP